jgi:cyanophycinase-like exopeptidase
MKRPSNPSLGAVIVLTFFLLVSASTNAQTSYDFTASSGTFTPLTGATDVNEIETDDILSNTIPIGFTFTFFGTDYTQLKAGSNGFLNFEVSGSDSYNENDIRNPGYPIIAPLWDDLNGGGGAASYKLEGTPGSQIFTFEWINWRWNYNATFANISFQVKLYEDGDKIEFIYNNIGGPTVLASASVGITGTDSDRFYSLFDTSPSATLDPSGNDLINTKPASGQTYAFLPASVPVAPATEDTNIQVANNDGSNLTLTWTNGNGMFHAVFIKQTSSTSEPAPITDGTCYGASATMGSIEGYVDDNWYCVYNGSGTTTTVTDLDSGLPYLIEVIGYNGLAANQKYNVSTSLNNPKSVTTTLIAPGAPESTIELSRVGVVDVTFEINNGKGSRRAVFIKQTALEETPPVVDNTTYTADIEFGAGSQIGSSGWFCVLNEAYPEQTSVTNLLPDKNYRIAVVDYNGVAGSEKYNIVSVTDNPVQIKTYPASANVEYSLSKASVTYSELTGANAIDEIESDDAISDEIPIGFTFNFSGQPFTKLRASSNGFITFNPYSNTSKYLASGSNALSETFFAPLIAPLWDDLDGFDGTALYKTTGSAGNKIFTIEFRNWQWNWGADVNISFQIKLYESDGKIECIYRQESGAVNEGAASIGLAFIDQGKFLSLDNATSSAVASTVDENRYISTRPETGQVFTFSPVRLSQTITFAALPQKIYGNPSFALTATASSSLPVAYASSNESIATISNGNVNIVGAGTVTITASQNGNALYAPASSVERTLTIDKANQTITFNAIGDKKLSLGSFILNAASDSGLPITFESSLTGVASVSGSKVTLHGTGTTDITASQAGNSNYNAAISVVQSLTVIKGDQVITFPLFTSRKKVGEEFELTATSSSGLTVTYTTEDTDVIFLSGKTVTVLGEGTATIVASQASEGFYNPATPVSRELQIFKSQTITLTPIGDRTLGEAPVHLSATASSGLPVIFSVNSDRALITESSKDFLALLEPGSVTITVTQPGNDVYDAAPPVEETICIKPIKPAITVSPDESGIPVLNSGFIWPNQWFRDGIAIEGETESTTKAIKSGSYTVQITKNDCSSLMSDAEVILITDTESSGVSIKLYPNPAGNYFVVDLTEWSLKRPAEVSITDMSGKQLQSWLGKGKINCNIEGLSQGNYIVNVKAGKSRLTRQLSKK